MKKLCCFRSVLLPAILAVTFPFYTWASDSNPKSATWKIIDESESSITYIDTSTDRDMGNSIRRIRTVINFKKRFGKAMSSLTVNDFDCRNRSVRYVKGEGYTEGYGQGSLIGTTHPEDYGMVPGNFSPVEQEDVSSSIRHLYELACS
jgi:hypothetical protein